MSRLAAPLLSLMLLGLPFAAGATEVGAPAAARAPRSEAAIARPALNAPAESVEAAEAPLELNAGTLLVLSLAVMGLHLVRRSATARR